MTASHFWDINCFFKQKSQTIFTQKLLHSILFNDIDIQVLILIAYRLIYFQVFIIQTKYFLKFLKRNIHIPFNKRQLSV
jgi:hypothetical protein